MGDRLYIVVPCFNEREILPETAKRLEIKMNELNIMNYKNRGDSL